MELQEVHSRGAFLVSVENLIDFQASNESLRCEMWDEWMRHGLERIERKKRAGKRDSDRNSGGGIDNSDMFAGFGD